jgi:hypothetical protein
VVELITKGIFLDVRIYGKELIVAEFAKAFSNAFPNRIDLISVPANTIPAVNFSIS